MTESAPLSVHPSEVFKNVAIGLGIICTGIAFLLWGCGTKTAEMTSAKVDARIRQQVEPYAVEFRKIETEWKGEQTRRERAEAELAELQAEKSAKPLLRARERMTFTISCEG